MSDISSSISWPRNKVGTCPRSAVPTATRNGHASAFSKSERNCSPPTCISNCSMGGKWLCMIR